jgi:hypothetical protein
VSHVVNVASSPSLRSHNPVCQGDVRHLR